MTIYLLIFIVVLLWGILRTLERQNESPDEQVWRAMNSAAAARASRKYKKSAEWKRFCERHPTPPMRATWHVPKAWAWLWHGHNLRKPQ